LTDATTLTAQTADASTCAKTCAIMLVDPASCWITGIVTRV